MGKFNTLLVFVLLGSVFADSNLDLWLAAKDGNLYDVQDALSAGADPEWINPDDNWDKWTPLHWAAYNNNPSIVIELLDNGAYINKGTHSDSNPLILASRAGNIEMVNVLIGRDAAINWRGISVTALISAAASNRLVVMDALLDAGADTDMESNGRTALYFASETGHTDAVIKLIFHGADLDIQTWNGEMTALMIAVQEGWFGVAAALIDAMANIELTNDRGLTALHIAAKYNQPNIAQLLLQKGADPYQQDDYGRTPRNIAEENGVSNQELDRFSVVIESVGEEPAPFYPDHPFYPPDDPEAAFAPLEYAPIEQETSTVTSDYAVYMLSGGVIMSMATSLFLILT